MAKIPHRKGTYAGDSVTLDELHGLINKRRFSGDSYSAIAADLGISKAMVRYIETHPGYRPSRRMRDLLNLAPDSNLAYTRSRREALDGLARAHGYSSWSGFETALLKGENNVF